MYTDQVDLVEEVVKINKADVYICVLSLEKCRVFCIPTTSYTPIDPNIPDL